MDSRGKAPTRGTSTSIGVTMTMQDLRDGGKVCEMTVQGLHDDFTVCKKAMQGLRDDFTVCKMTVQDLRMAAQCVK